MSTTFTAACIIRGSAEASPKRELSRMMMDQQSSSPVYFLQIAVKKTPSTNSYLQSCYRNGWLQAGSVYRMKTNISYMCFLHGFIKGNIILLNAAQIQIQLSNLVLFRSVENILRKQSPSFPSLEYPTVEKFCFSAIRTFRRSSLASSPRGARHQRYPKASQKLSIKMSCTGRPTKYQEGKSI